MPTSAWTFTTSVVSFTLCIQTYPDCPGGRIAPTGVPVPSSAGKVNSSSVPEPA